jgi:hypothetical protein
MNGYDINIASESDSSEVTKGQKPSASSPQSKTCEPNFSSYNKVRMFSFSISWLIVI